MPDTTELVEQLSSRISIFDIFVGPRRRRDYGDMEELKKDFLENGQITAITVCPPTDEDKASPDYQGEPWSLVAGGRRLRAALEIGWPSIRAIDRESMDELTRRVLELAENLKRKDMSFVEVAQAKQEMYQLRLSQNPELTQAEVAREIGESPANFSRDLAVAHHIERRPELKGASSRKAVLRQAVMADHYEARKIRDEFSGETHMMQLAERMVTADMVDWLKEKRTGFAELVIADLPYGIDHYKQGHKTLSGEGGLSEYDDSEGVSLELFRRAVPELLRITKETGWIVCFMSEANYDYLRMLFENVCLQHFHYRVEDEEGWAPEDRCTAADSLDCLFGRAEEPRWFWYRPNSNNNPRYPEIHAKNVIEHLLVFNRGKGKLLRPCDNVLMHDAEYGSRIHAMQKPIELLKELIGIFTLPGETVVDPCFGSGATLAAGADLARDIHGCEKNPALLAPARGFVSQFYSGVAPRGRVPDVAEFVGARLEGEDYDEDEDFEMADEDFAELNFDHEED